MSQSTVTHSTFVIERSYPASPQRVFSAFADPAKKKRWFMEGDGFESEAFEADFRVGGKEYSRFRPTEESPVKGMAISNHTWYQDIVENKRIVVAYTMTVGDYRMSASLATFEMLPEGSGTKLVFTEQGAFFENSDGPKLREGGWSELLERLGKELESE